jgi:uncharacterized protein YeeX (DUF496 family)
MNIYITNEFKKFDKELLNNYIDCHIENIDSIVYDSEAKNIYLDNLLEYIEEKDIYIAIEKIVKKMRKKGTLLITGIDSYIVAKDYVSKRLTNKEYNRLVYGESGCFKKNSLSLHELSNFLQDKFGLKIITRNIEDYQYIVEAKRE